MSVAERRNADGNDQLRVAISPARRERSCSNIGQCLEQQIEIIVGETGSFRELGAETYARDKAHRARCACGP